jgi:hypothetical protein
MLQNADAKSREFGQEENLFWKRRGEGGTGSTKPSASEWIIRILVLLTTFLEKAFARVAEK